MKKNIGRIISIIVILALIVLSIIFGRTGLSENQVTTLGILLIVCGCSFLYCFIVGEITQNFSQMDKLWSLLPIAYVWIIAGRGGMSARLVEYALIVTAWGIRLTINFARKGAYRLKFWEGEEDYRWSIVHQSPMFQKKSAWVLFNLLFISLYQNLLVLAICLPDLACMESTKPFGVWDVIATVLAVGFLALETISDEYQWKFHQEKKRLLAEGLSLEEIPSPYNLGFNTLGPWSRLRHPNYLGEQGIWLSLYIFTIGAGVTNLGIFHWTFVGPLLLTLLFMGSSSLGETISSGKYPRYADYLEQVYKYIPAHKFDPEAHAD